MTATKVIRGRIFRGVLILGLSCSVSGCVIYPAFAFLLLLLIWGIGILIGLGAAKLFEYCVSRGLRRSFTVPILLKIVAVAGFSIGFIWVIGLLFPGEFQSPKDVSRSDFVGSWNVTKNSADELERRGNDLKIGGIILLLGDDGRYELLNAPERFEDLKGFWSLRFSPTRIHLESSSNLNNPIRSGPLSVSSKAGKLFLWDFLGDEDESLRIVFEK